MPPKKSAPSKKSLEYVRPEPGRFTLEKFPGVEFRFRIITVDDEAWCVQNLGKTPWAIISSNEVMAADLCRMYFHFLEEEFKEKFVPVKKTERDYETGEVKEVIISGSRLFMQSIDGGSLTEMTLIAKAFFDTCMASRPLDALPEDLKKSLLKQIQKAQAKPEPTPGPMGSEVVDLRTAKTA